VDIKIYTMRLSGMTTIQVLYKMIINTHNIMVNHFQFVALKYVQLKLADKKTIREFRAFDKISKNLSELSQTVVTSDNGH
jgi:hypothetical protein